MICMAIYHTKLPVVRLNYRLVRLPFLQIFPCFVKIVFDLRQLISRPIVGFSILVLCSLGDFLTQGPLSCSRFCTLVMGGTLGGWILSLAYKFFAQLGFGGVALFESWFDEIWAFGLETLPCCSSASGLFHNLCLRGSLCSLLPLNFIFESFG